jgi:hypothetical protein
VLLTPEDGIISSSPNGPAHRNNNLHEKRSLKMILEDCKCLKQTALNEMSQAQSVPATYSKGAMEKQMH